MSDTAETVLEATPHGEHKQQSASFHRRPNSESFHVVKNSQVDEAEVVGAEDEDQADEKSPSFHRLPNKETFHLVHKGDPEVEAELAASEAASEKHPSFHRLPAKESFHVVKGKHDEAAATEE